MMNGREIESRRQPPEDFWPIGIDLGSHSSVVASGGLVTVGLFGFSSDYRQLNSSISVDSNSLSNQSTPTIISFHNRQRLIGEEAEAKLISNSENSITHLLQILGVQFSELEDIKKRFSYTFTCATVKDDKSDRFLVPIKFNKETYEVSSDFLLSIYIKSLIKLTNYRHGGDLMNSRITISIPSSYGEKQYEALRNACYIAGTKNIMFIKNYESVINCWANKNLPTFFNEVTVIANNTTETNHSKNEDQNLETEHHIYVAFFYCGYAETYFVITKIGNRLEDDNKFDVRVVARHINPILGTHEMIIVLMTYAINRANEKYSNINWTRRHYAILYQMCSKCLKELNGLPMSSINLESVLEDVEDVEIDISRKDFENLCCGIKMKIVKILEDTLSEANIDKSYISGCEVLGDGSRIPFVLNIVEAFFQNDKQITRKTMDSSSSAAVGAVMYSMGRFFLKTEIQNDINLINDDDLSNKLQELVHVENKMEAIEENEICRMKYKNELESYLIYLKTEMEGKFKNLLDNPKLAELMDEKETWLQNADEYNTVAEEYKSELDNLKNSAEMMCPQFFEQLKAEAEAKEKEIENCAQERRMVDDMDIKLTPSQALRKAKKNKDEGNDLYKDGNVDMAILRYIKSLQYLNKLYDVPPQFIEEINATKVAINLNLAQSYIKVGTEISYRKAISCCESALEIDPNNLKALYRSALSKECLKDYESAHEIVNKGLRLAAGDSFFLKLNERIERQLKIQKEKEKKMYGRMFA